MSIDLRKKPLEEEPSRKHGANGTNVQRPSGGGFSLRGLIMNELKDQLEEERRKEAEERQRKADAAVVPHPLRGRDSAFLDDYVRGQLMLREEGRVLDEAGVLLHPFAVGLGIPLARFEVLQKEVAAYDSQAKVRLWRSLPNLLKQPDEVVCFLCDLARLHGETYALEGEFLEQWRAVCIAVFHVDVGRMAALERLASRIAEGGGRKLGDDFGDLPQALVRYYLESQPVAGNRQYLVVDLSGGANASQYPIRYTNETPKLLESACRTMELWLRCIPKGSFMMGSPENELGHKDYEKHGGLLRLLKFRPENELGHKDYEKQHQVTLTQDFYIGVFPCTQRQYELVMGKTSRFKGDDYPVERVSYDDLRWTDKGSKWPEDAEVDEGSFFGRLQARTGLTFDLPTEAQWEYACRAGTMTSLNSGKNITSTNGRCLNLDSVAWYDKNSAVTPHPVGQKQPNEWGLYDMHGNVLEWCLDWYGDYPNTAVEDPPGAQSGVLRVHRGGNWYSSAQHCRSAHRDSYVPRIRSSIGFRVALRP